MTVRRAKDSDIAAIDTYCGAHGIATPIEGLVFIAETDTGQIQGVISAINRIVIEPMISDNPHTATRLWDHVMGALQMQSTEYLYLRPTDEKLAQEAEKMGFRRIKEGVILLEKKIYG